MSGLIYISNDFGVTWEAVETDSTDMVPIDLIRASDNGPLFALRDDTADPQTNVGRIGRSTDGGTWEWFIDPLGLDDNKSQPMAIAYTFTADELYIQYTDGKVYGLLNASQVDVDLANIAVQAAGEEANRGATLYETVYWYVLPEKRSGVGGADPGDGPHGRRALAAQKKGR